MLLSFHEKVEEEAEEEEEEAVGEAEEKEEKEEEEEVEEEEEEAKEKRSISSRWLVKGSKCREKEGEKRSEARKSSSCFGLLGKRKWRKRARPLAERGEGNSPRKALSRRETSFG